MARHSRFKRQIRRLFFIHFTIEVVVGIGTIVGFGYLCWKVGLYFFWQEKDVPWIEVGKFTAIGIIVLAAYASFLWRLVRRRLSSGIVSSRKTWSEKRFSQDLRESEGKYLFVGNSFSPYIATFLDSFDLARREVSLVLASTEEMNDRTLAQEHLNVIKALKGAKVEFRTMQRSRSLRLHLFNAENEDDAFMVLELSPPEGGPAIILELEKTPNRYSLFDHFVSEANDVYDLSSVRTVEYWSRDLAQLTNSEK